MALQEEFEAQGNFLFKFRGILPLIILFVGLGIFVRMASHLPARFDVVDTGVEGLACLAISLLGLAVRVWTVGCAARNTSGRNTSKQLADEINTTGIYSLVRHPLYIGNFLMWLGIAFLTHNIPFVAIFVLLYWVYYERIMFAEEQFLREKFGDAYLGWAAKTPAFIPKLTGYQAPRYGFCMKKALRREKNGFFAIFLTFYLFDVIGASVQQHKLVIEYNFWFFSMVVGLLFYITIKLLWKHTSVLQSEPQAVEA